MVLFEISKDEQLRESLIWIETQGMLGEQIIVPVYRGEYARFESPYKVTIISGEPFIQDNMVTFPRVFLVPDHQGLPQGFLNLIHALLNHHHQKYTVHLLDQREI